MKECVVTSYCLVLSGNYQRKDYQIGRYYWEILFVEKVVKVGCVANEVD